MENEDNQWLNIVNLDKLINFSRKVVYANLGEEYSDASDANFLHLVENMPEEQQEEMNSILSLSEARAITSSQGKSLSERMLSISLPTLPVAPTTANLFIPIFGS